MKNEKPNLLRSSNQILRNIAEGLPKLEILDNKGQPIKCKRIKETLTVKQAIKRGDTGKVNGQELKDMNPNKSICYYVEEPIYVDHFKALKGADQKDGSEGIKKYLEWVNGEEKRRMPSIPTTAEVEEPKN